MKTSIKIYPAWHIISGLIISGWIAGTAFAQEWREPVRGSWVREQQPQNGDTVLVAPGNTCEIVVANDAHTAVKQAAIFLAEDVRKISGQKPKIVATPSVGQISIHLVTLGDKAQLPSGITQEKLKGQWEAYQILTQSNAVWLVGSDARGTAFSAYTLSERLGIDPLYFWTGYQPQKHERLVLAKTDFFSGSPTVKYRGMFHDDEDILPRPFEYSGYPLALAMCRWTGTRNFLKLRCVCA